MMERWNHLSETVGDLLLGWSLSLPSDVTLLVVATLSALLFTLIRRWTTNQDRLRRAAADKRRLRGLIREAKRRKDRDALLRHRATRARIGLLSLKAEGVPLLVAIGPIAVLATWCALRLEFHPPRGGEPIRLAVYAPVSAAGGWMHLVPEDGVEADGWIRRVEAVADDGPPHGLATWELEAAAREEPYRITVRHRGKSLVHELRVGTTTYAPSVVEHGGGIVSELRYEPVRLLGRLPGIPALALPPWLVAYLILTIPLIFALRGALRVR